MITTALLICRRLLLQPDNMTSQIMFLPPASTAAGIQATNASLTATLRGHFTISSDLYIPLALLIVFLLFSVVFVGFAACARRSSAAVEEGGSVSSSGGSSLPTVAYGEDAKQRIIEECAICLSEFQEGESVKLIPYCGHVFHSACIDTWLSRHVTCPMCRSSRFFNTKDAPRTGL